MKQAAIADATNQLDYDDEVAFHAVAFLKDQARSAKRRPFFVTVSFTHPHDLYAIRAAHWNRYEDREIDLPRVSPLPPERMDAHSKRLRRVSAMDEVEISEADVRRARRAYYGAISYVDDHVGELLAILRTFGLAENTVMFFTADAASCSGSGDSGTRCTFSSGRRASRSSCMRRLGSRAAGWRSRCHWWICCPRGGTRPAGGDSGRSRAAGRRAEPRAPSPRAPVRGGRARAHPHDP